MKASEQKKKMFILLGIIFAYVAVGAVVLLLVNMGAIPKAPFKEDVVDNSTDSDPTIESVNPTESLVAALFFLNGTMKRPNGHIDLYLPIGRPRQEKDNYTNSEAVSYYMQVQAQQSNKKEFDQMLGYMQRYMLHPTGSYMMWELSDRDRAEGQGENIASDADLRALRALYIAKDKWGDPRYDEAISELVRGLELVAIDENNVLLAYGGMSGDKPWRGDVSYLAYSDFQTIDRLANTRGGVWIGVAQKMRNVTLGAQIWNGLYNSEYWSSGSYGTAIDGGVYSINSLWIMVRFAESGDPVLMESAMKSLRFYQEQYAKDSKVYISYKSDGTVAQQAESPWNYALIARAAYALDEKAFAQLMERRMLDFQDLDPQSPSYGALVEGSLGGEVAGQFTLQESILTMQEMQGKAPRFNE